MRTALYYPLIDPRNKQLLLNSLLYWDEIATIVPQSIQDPYNNELTHKLESLGVLIPERVNPTIESVKSASDDMLTLVRDHDVLSHLADGESSYEMLYIEKFSPSLHNAIEYAGIYPDKMGYFIQNMLGRENLDHSQPIQVERNFLRLYMSILAKKIAITNGYTPITDNSYLFRASPDYAIGENDEDWTRSMRNVRRHAINYPEISKAIAINASLEMVSLPEDTEPEKILEFKALRKDELSRYREKLDSFSIVLDENLSLAAVKKMIENKINDTITPENANLKRLLRENGMLYGVTTIASTAAIALSPTSMLSQLGISGSFGIAALGGLGLTASILKYRKDRQEAIKNNPYSYLLFADQYFNQ